MFAWRRPYSDAFRIFTGLIAVAGSGFACLSAVMIILHWRSGIALPAASFAGFVGLWLTFAWRLHRTALLVGNAGIRVRWLLRTRTIPWSRISQFRTAPDLLVRKRLWIVLTDGRMVRTPIQRVNQAFGGSALSDGGTWLRGSRYENLLETLNREMQSHDVTAGG